ncbi:MAG: DNA repair protein RadA [Ruminococcaceae bacterium]|nr:DNA repair protein RadA [Oscillospiraceae bacterium]
MAKDTVFFCSECGYKSSKWLGKCPDCNSWNTFNEEKLIKDSKTKKYTVVSNVKPLKIDEVPVNKELRITTGIKELDRVLGGGVVIGSVNLVGGDPGIGKSTLLLQMCRKIKDDVSVLYCSSEESVEQIKLRANRLSDGNKNIFITSKTSIDLIIEDLEEIKPQIAVIDSIQTIFSDELDSAPGTVSQIRECTLKITRFAKENNITVFIVGHVTKDGALAGPKVLEHMVDCVLQFEGERYSNFRIIRSVKNRFGSTNEIGVFEMTDQGLKEVENPSNMFLEGRPKNASGTVVICSMEGTRPILAEIQALVTNSAFGNPRRMATGIDFNRSNLVLAVLEKKTGLNLASLDTYINVTGGLKIYEPACDLGIAVSVASSFKNKPIDDDLVVFGELGLTGEVRNISFLEKRITEAHKLGFKKCVIPYTQNNIFIEGLEIIKVKNIIEAFGAIF